MPWSGDNPNPAGYWEPPAGSTAEKPPSSSGIEGLLPDLARIAARALADETMRRPLGRIVAAAVVELRSPPMMPGGGIDWASLIIAAASRAKEPKP